MLQQITNNSVQNFLQEVFTLAQNTLDSFYTDCIILPQPPDGVEVISLNGKPAIYTKKLKIFALLHLSGTKFIAGQHYRVF